MSPCRLTSCDFQNTTTSGTGIYARGSRANRMSFNAGLEARW